MIWYDAGNSSGPQASVNDGGGDSGEGDQGGK
jgi:hypothetical protein